MEGRGWLGPFVVYSPHLGRLENIEGWIRLPFLSSYGEVMSNLLVTRMN